MTTLTLASSSSFPVQDRIRGEKYLRQRRIRLLKSGSLGAIGLAVGSSSKPYKLALDFRSLDIGELGICCSCPQFSIAGTCKHAYGFIRVTDGALRTSILKQRVNLVECDYDDVKIGPPLGNNRLGFQPKPELRVTTIQPTPSSPQSWVQSLEQIRSLHRQNAGMQPRPRSDQTMAPTRLLYVLEASDFADSDRFRVHAMQETSLTSGGEIADRPPRVQRFVIDEKTLAAVNDAADRRILTLLSVDAPTDPSDEIDAEDFGFDERYYKFSNDDEENDDDDDDARVGARTLAFSQTLVEETLVALCDSKRFYWTLDIFDRASYRSITWNGSAPWRLMLQVQSAEPDSYRVMPQLHRLPKSESDPADEPERRPLADIVGVCTSGALLFQDSATVISPSDAAIVAVWRRLGEMTIPASDLDNFLQRIVEVVSLEQLVLPEHLKAKTVTGTPRGRLMLQRQRLEMNSGRLYATPEVIYGSAAIGIGHEAPAVWDADAAAFIQRDLSQEAELLQGISSHPNVHPTDAYTTAPFFALSSELPELVTDLSDKGWEVWIDGRHHRNRSSCTLSVSSGQDWFDLDAVIDFDGKPVDFPDLLAAIRNGQRYVQLGDGSYGMLPDAWIKRFEGMSELGTATDGRLRFQRSQALMLDLWLENQPTQRDRSFSTWCRKLKNFSGIKPKKEPAGFRGELRPYQREGLGWFNFLQDFGFGGCLADDMGLGKTIQVLAMLERRRAQKTPPGERKPSIAVVPKSLVYNWVAEAAKFAPKLKVIDYTGLHRNELQPELASADLIVTTYATFRIDVEELKELRYDYAILDEAQAIKNPACQAAKAVRLIQADHRLAMTGTPIENHLGDLWSILNFLNPGMLGSLSPNHFSGANSGSEEGSERLEALGRALRPFILRRTKSQVLTELPEKSEQVIYCEMTPKQKKHYQQMRTYYAQNLKQKVADIGLQRAKIHVLEALLRLRQVACDPRLVNKSEKSVGTKILTLMEQLEELRAEGHKALIFSQFTSMLDLVRTEVKKRHWDYEYLDGKSTRRGAIVDRFQQDPNCQLFLISLKAGGHGLNLTAADYVYILDPWWNPAVEAQAVDRAHRMGQQRPVLAYRLIARDTVEEKIASMQESKKQLADAVISGDQSLLKSLSMDDLRVLFE